ncbi:LPXTG cell wall anchor domain-containing protein, partial [Facklamia sp. P12932]|uniref:LPXTG cell wall anchor domain-containing protein n=1 Tax=Facklamia sp. P12932 TaxID=3421947 RepID=UPI003D16C171
WSYDFDTMTFMATDEKAPELYTYKLIVKTADTNITSEYKAESMQAADQYFHDYVAGQGLKGLEWSYDFDTMTFMATDEKAPKLYTFKLVLKTSDTNITSEYEAASMKEAEKYFHDYVARFGLGELVWSYDEETMTFMVTEKPADEKPADEKPKNPKPVENKKEKSELPQTGEGSTFAIYGAAALSVLAGLGLVAKKREEA